MSEYLCPFDFLQFGPLLAIHASILLMNADWSGTDLRLTTTRDPFDGIWSWRAFRNVLTQFLRRLLYLYFPAGLSQFLSRSRTSNKNLIVEKDCFLYFALDK